MSWSGPDGTPGQVGPDLQGIGVPSPQSVEKIEVIKLQWEFLSGCQIMRRIEIWHSNLCIASSESSIGITGHSGHHGIIHDA